MRERQIRNSLYMVANRWIQFSFILLSTLSTVMLLGCGRYERFEIYIVNELQECEEDNIHYTILTHEEDFQKKFGKIILPKLSAELASEKYFNLLWPSETMRRLKLKVRGYFRANDSHNNYGCVGSKVFVIESVIDVVDVTKSMNYVISN